MVFSYALVEKDPVSILGTRFGFALAGFEPDSFVSEANSMTPELRLHY
jgi:hypothetical protein